MLQQQENSFGENGWNPYNPTDASNNLRDSYHPTSSYNNRNLAYDSYSPKYNNNNQDDNYNWNENGSRQRGSSIASDMYTSASSNRPKKVVVVTPKAIPKRPQSKQKVKVKVRNGKRPPPQNSHIPETLPVRDVDLTRDLSPPPPE